MNNKTILVALMVVSISLAYAGYRLNFIISPSEYGFSMFWLTILGTIGCFASAFRLIVLIADKKE